MAESIVALKERHRRGPQGRDLPSRHRFRPRPLARRDRFGLNRQTVIHGCANGAILFYLRDALMPASTAGSGRRPREAPIWRDARANFRTVGCRRGRRDDGPAFLAFPVLGLWYVVRVWPGMSLFDRGLFCFALAAFFGGLPYGFRRGLQRVKEGRDDGLSPIEEALMIVPILAGGWALLHRIDTLVFMTLWFGLDLYRSDRRHRRIPPSSTA